MILYANNKADFTEFLKENDKFILGIADTLSELAITINQVYNKIYHEEVKDFPKRPIIINTG